jgi:hypothetical protein
MTSSQIRKEGTQTNPFPINWPKPASADYPKLYFGAERDDYKSQTDLKQLVGKQDDKGVIVREYSPHTQTDLPNGDSIGVSANYHLQVGTVVGPLAKSGVKSPGGRVLNTILAKYGFRPEEDKLDGDHVHEIQLGGPNIVENMWPLSKYINRSSGKTIDETSVLLASNKSIKVYQLRELVKKINKQFYFKVSSVK